MRRCSREARPKSFHGTCSNCRACCCCRTCARTAGTCSSPRATPGPRCKDRPGAGPARATPCRSPRMHPPTLREHICRWQRPSAWDASADPFPRDRGPTIAQGRSACACAKNAGSARRDVVSQAVALAPFSQNSSGCGCAGFAQAQLTHIYPSGLFCVESNLLPFKGTCSPTSIPATDFAEPQPPAGPLYGLMWVPGFRSHFLPRLPSEISGSRSSSAAVCLGDGPWPRPPLRRRKSPAG